MIHKMKEHDHIFHFKAFPAFGNLWDFLLSFANLIMIISLKLFYSKAEKLRLIFLHKPLYHIFLKSRCESSVPRDIRDEKTKSIPKSSKNM